MTNQNDSQKKELDELLERLANRELTSNDNAHLEEQLASDASARQTYICNSVFEAMLSYEFPSLEAVALCPPEQPKPSRFYRNLAGMLALAAAVLIGFWLGYQVLLDRTQSQVAQDTTANDNLLASQIATVTSVSNSTGFHKGQRLLAGPVELLSGELELTLDCGAVVSLVGPAKLDLQSDYRAFLHFGGLSAHVPQEAVGFIVQTPNSHIRDLGTSFTIKVAKNGDTDLHVIEGAVEATSVRIPRATPKVVSETQAIRFVGSSVEPLRYEAESFSSPKQSDQIERSVNYVHWSFDRIGDDTDSYGTIVAPLRLKRLNPMDAIPTTASGVIGNSLSFDGMGGYAESTYRGIEGDGARTVAFWIRLPDLSHEGNRNCIISWGLPVPSKKWEIIWNRSASLGTVGAVRVDFGKGRVVGSTDLRDSLWHHVAIVFHGGRGANLSTHVKLYVDGRLETVTGKLQQQILTDTSTPGAVPVTLGRFIDSRAKVLTSYFIGELDELFIVDEAMTPSQIVRLKESNRIQP